MKKKKWGVRLNWPFASFLLTILRQVTDWIGSLNLTSIWKFMHLVSNIPWRCYISVTDLIVFSSSEQGMVWTSLLFQLLQLCSEQRTPYWFLHSNTCKSVSNFLAKEPMLLTTTLTSWSLARQYLIIPPHAYCYSSISCSAFW